MNLNEVKTMIPAHTHGVFATVDAENKPDVRGWQFQVFENGRFYFFTSNKKDVWAQILVNPSIAFMCNADGYTFRIYGDAIQVTDPAEIKRLHDTADEGVRAVYPTAEANGFTVFYLEHGKISYAKGFVPFTTIDF